MQTTRRRFDRTVTFSGCVAAAVTIFFSLPSPSIYVLIMSYAVPLFLRWPIATPYGGCLRSLRRTVLSQTGSRWALPVFGCLRPGENEFGNFLLQCSNDF